VWQFDLFTGRSQGKPEKQEPKRRTAKQSEGPRTGTRNTVVQTDEAVVNDDKVQSDAKQPAARSTSATGLIAAFRPVEQLPASSAAASLPASTAGSNASDRQAADDLQVLELRTHVVALLLRAKVPRLEWSAHTPEDVREKENAGTSVCLSTPCCYSASCAILCPLFSISASSCTRLDRCASSNLELASFISTFYICHVQSSL